MTDEDLLIKLTQGDKASFDAVYKKYASQLFGFARKNIQSREDCEEIVQDVFLSLWARHQSLEIQSLKHYLFNAVRYKIIRYFQHNSVKTKYETHFRHFEASTYEDSEIQVDPEHIRKKLMHHLASLPARCQEAFRLRLEENLSNNEIAQRMNIAKKTVELYMFKAFDHLRTNGQDIINPDQDY